MAKYEEYCIEILKKHGPLLGSELNQFLVEKAGVTKKTPGKLFAA